MFVCGVSARFRARQARSSTALEVNARGLVPLVGLPLFRSARSVCLNKYENHIQLRKVTMSLTVPAELLDEARSGAVSDDAFLRCIHDSLPYAWSVVQALASQLAEADDAFADNQTEPPDEASRGQLLRLVGSDAMRAAVERHFNVRLAFQNCHRLALFSPDATQQHAEFVTARAQILNQKPELVNC